MIGQEAEFLPEIDTGQSGEARTSSDSWRAPGKESNASTSPYATLSSIQERQNGILTIVVCLHRSEAYMETRDFLDSKVGRINHRLILLVQEGEIVRSTTFVGSRMPSD